MVFEENNPRFSCHAIHGKECWVKPPSFLVEECELNSLKRNEFLQTNDVLHKGTATRVIRIKEELLNSEATLCSQIYGYKYLQKKTKS